MKTNIFNFFAILMATVLFVSCSEESTFGGDIAEVVATPKAWEPTSDFYTSEGATYVNVDIIFDDENVTKEDRHQVSLLTEDTITAVGDYPFFCEEDLSEAREAKASMQYAYCYNKTNTIKVKGLIMSYEYNGKTYSLPCASTITVVGNMAEAEETEAGLANATVYTAVADGKTLAEGVQEFLAVKPDAEDVLESISFNWEHNAFVKNAEFANNIITGYCNNTASWHENWSVSGKKNEVETSFQMKHVFSYTSTKTEVDDLTAIVGKSFDFVNGEVAVIGAKVNHTGSEIVGELNYNNKSYNDSVEVCKVAAKSISVVSATEGIVKFYDNNAEDYFEVSVPLQVTEKVKLISQVENFVHDAYRKAATFANNVITVICDNHMDVTKTYSDNTTDEDKVNYTVSNFYDITMPKFILNDSKSIVGISVNFDNGIAEVLGQNVVVKHRSMNVSDIIYDNKNYVNDSRRPNCQPTAKTITFVSSEEAVISFEDEGEIVAEAKVPVSVKVAINFDGVLVKGWATDSYIDGGQGVAAHEGTYFHFVVNKNGAYTMYSAKVKEEISVADFTATSVSEAFVNTLSNEKPAAFTGKSASTYDLGYINKIVKYSEDTYIIQYYNSNGKLDRTVGQSGAAIGSNYRYPIRGTWSEDVISVEGTTYYITGSQN